MVAACDRKEKKAVTWQGGEEERCGGGEREREGKQRKKEETIISQVHVPGGRFTAHRTYIHRSNMHRTLIVLDSKPI